MSKITAVEKLIIHDHFPELRRHQFRIPNLTITINFLNDNPNIYFIYGDNILHKGKGGAAALRDQPNTIGFITKKFPNDDNTSFYHPDEYLQVFHKECDRLITLMKNNPHHYYLFSKIGSGLANKYCIFQLIIEPWLLSLENKFTNCSLLF